LSQYSSATQFDSYLGIGDTSPSTGCSSCRHNQVLLDSWARKTSEKLVNNPIGTVSVDTTYDSAGRVQSQSHPYVSLSDPNHVFETFTYDGLDRQIQVNHPDGQYSQAAYGASIASAGGLSSQLGSTSSYGFGYPVVSVDEAGKQIQKWVDGFGRVIEVDEPGAQSSSQSPSTAGSGSGTVNGTEGYSGALAATPGTGYAWIGGHLDSSTVIYPCGEQFCPRTIWDTGTVSVTVNGFVASVSYGATSTDASIASALAAVFNTNQNSPVTATTSTSNACYNSTDACVINLTTKATGSATNYSLSATSMTNQPQYFSPSFNPGVSGSALRAGNDAQPATYDSGTVYLTVNGYQASATYQQGSTTSSLASALASVFNGDPSSPVTTSAASSVVTVTSKQTGVNTNYSLSSSSSSSLPARFPSPSFTVSVSGAELTGGADAVPGTISNPVGTFYTYDVLGNPTQVSQGVQTRTFVYDGLSRPTSVSTPEAGTDLYYYTASSGGLCSGDPSAVCRKIDARGVTTTLSYDSLGRLLGKAYTIPQGSNVAAMPGVCVPAGTSLPSQNVCFNYDQGGAAAYAVGRLTQMVDPTGSEAYTFNKAGRITQVQKVIGTATYTTGYVYNVGGELTQITYPSGRAVQKSYDAVGQLCQVATQTSACGNSSSPFATIPSPTGYDAAGRVLALNYGNGVAANYTYSASRSQLSGLSYTNGSQTLFSLSYFYQQNSPNCTGAAAANNGHIQCIADAVDSGRTVNYTFDFLGRLTTAATNGSANYPEWGLSETYDRYANRLSQSIVSGCVAPFTCPTSSLTFATNGGALTNHPDGWCFDASGNLLAKNPSTCPPSAPTYAFDAENRMVSDSPASAAYTYDGNGLRIQKAVGSTSTVYIFSGSRNIAEYDNGAVPTSPTRENIYAGGQLLTTITGGSTPTTTYFHPDHLSVRLSTDGTLGSPTYGQVIGQQGHFPFGETWYTQNSTTKRFYTTYERDAESGLDYALARYFDSSAARFCSADPLGGWPDNPQSWNRYAYVQNDPIDLTDPSGKGFLSFLIKAFNILLAFLTGGRLQIPLPPGGTPPILANDAGIALQPVLLGGNNQHLRTPPFFPAGAYPTFAEILQKQLLNALSGFEGTNCNKVFGLVIKGFTAAKFKKEAQTVKFYSARTMPDAASTQDQVVGNGSQTTLNNSVPYGDDAATIWGKRGEAIIIAPNFETEATSADQGNVLKHELLHAYTRWTDNQVFNAFKGYGLQRVNPGTDDISTWIGTDCRYTPRSAR
jgi:RHS repeat-associated protein